MLELSGIVTLSFSKIKLKYKLLKKQINVLDMTLNYILLWGSSYVV